MFDRLHPDSKYFILVVAVIGLIIRFALSSFQFVYDNDYWSLVIRNIEAGEGLYGVRGYFYTPIWGYVLGAVSAFQTLFLDLGMDSVRVLELFFAEGVPGIYYAATIPSIAFSTSVKLPLMMFDLVLALLVRCLVMDVTDDVRKGNAAFTLTFLCPLLFCVSCISTMPDVIAAVFMMLTLVLVRRDRFFVAGMAFAMAVLTKFFPIFLFFPLIGYIFAKKGVNRTSVTCLLYSAFGAVMIMLVMFFPQIIDGTMDQCFQFLTDRTGTSEDDTLFKAVIGRMRVFVYALVLLASLYLGNRLYRKGREGVEDRFLFYSFLVMTLCMVYPPTPQYIIVVLPLLVFMTVVRDGKLMASWKLLAVFGAMFVLDTNVLTLSPLAAWTDIIDISWIASAFSWMSTGTASVTVVWMLFSSLMTYFAILSILIITFRNEIMELIGRWKAARTA